MTYRWFAMVAMALLFFLAACSGTDAPEVEPNYWYDGLPPAEEASTAVQEFKALSKWHKVDINYHFVNGSGKLAGNLEHEIVRRAFEIWAAETPLTFTEVADRASADIEIGWASGAHDGLEPFDGPGNVLAHATFPNPFAPRRVLLRFDEDERWVDSPAQNVDLLTVAIHEIGHTLGLGHSRDQLAVMYAAYSGPRRALAADDIAGIQELYGAGGVIAQAPATPASGAAVPPSRNTDSDGDGLSDAEEVYITRTSPTEADTDGDGLGDGVEVLNRLNPLDADMDKDGVSDGDEIRNGTNPLFPNQPTAATAETTEQVSRFLAEAIQAQVEAYRTGSASPLSNIFAQDLLAQEAARINQLNDEGLRQISQFDYYKSYIKEVRVLSQRQIEVDTCEVWTNSVYKVADGTLSSQTPQKLTPQTLTLRQLDIGWFITAVSFYEAPAFCNR